MRVGSCRFSEAAIGTFAAAFCDTTFKGLSLQKYREGISQAVGPPSDLFQTELMRFAGPQSLQHRPVPDWLGYVAEHRDFFSRCFLRLEETGRPHRHFAFLSAVLAPRIRVALLPLTADEDADPLELALELHAGVDHAEWQSSFRFSHADIVWSHMSDAFEGDLAVSVLTDTCYFDRHRAGSDSDWLSWDDILVMLRGAGPKRRSGDEVAPSRPRANAAAVEQHPWLLDVFAAAQQDGHRRRGADGDRDRVGAGGSTHGLVAEGADELAPIAPEDVFEEVQRRRLLWAADHGEEVEHFSTHLRGGAWTAARTGEAIDSLRCAAATTQAKDFCIAHQLPQTSTFSLQLYGDEACALLGSVWVSRMSFIMETAACFTDPAKPLAPVDLEGYIPIEAAQDLRARGVPAIAKRLDGILALRPGYML